MQILFIRSSVWEGELIMCDIDNISRNRIANDLNCNFFVEAGAGSGKTTMLVQRMVAMIEAGVDVEKICAITFTKAAAAEFYSRFQEELMKRNSVNSRRALENIDLCFMGTIDAFCNMVINEHPVEAGVPIGATVKSNDELKAAYAREYTRIIKGDYGEELQEKARNFEGIHNNSIDKFLLIMFELMGYRTDQFIYDKPSESALKRIQDAEVKIKSIVSLLLEHEELLHNTKNVYGAWEYLVSNQRLLLDSWDGRYVEVMDVVKKISDIRLAKDADLTLLGPYAESAFNLEGNRTITYNVDIDGPLGIYQEFKEYQYSVSMDFVASAVHPVAAHLKKQGIMGFFDYLLYLRNLLHDDAKNGGKLIKHIYNRHSYFLIDEFQDTDPIQAEIFFFITAKEPKEDWKECVPHPGSLFIVGDPKQSIYRFRGADVGAYKVVRGLFDGEKGEVLNMLRNFRSTTKLCKWFNEVFSQIMGEETIDQSKFQPIPIDNHKNEENCLAELSDASNELDGVYKYKTDDIGGDAEAISEIINRLVNNPEYSIDGEPINYSDFMVITKNKKDIDNYIKEFVDQGIPYRVEGKVLFRECPSLKATIAAFKAAAVPEVREYVFAARRLGFDVNRLKCLNNNMTPVALFDLILDKEKIFEKFGTENIEYLYFAEELLRNEVGLSMEESALFLENLMKGDSGEERCINLDENSNRVHIANLHKVKGLQSKIVILAQGSSFINKVDSRSSDNKCWIFKIGHYGDIATKKYNNAADDEKASNEAEYYRLMYVAATRAKNVLFIADPKKKNYWQDIKELAPNDFKLKECEVNVGSDITKTSPLTNEEHIVPIMTNSCNRKTYEILRPSKIRTVSEDSDETFVPEDVMYADEVPEGNPALVGTMVHRLMEKLVSSGGWQGSDDILVNSIVEEYGLNISAKLASIVSVLRNGGYAQENGMNQDILHTLLNADQVFCEVPFCYMNDRREMFNGVMDAIYYVDNKWHIVDYKTNANGHGLDEVYKEQLNSYINAFKELTGMDADAKTYHIDLRTA